MEKIKLPEQDPEGGDDHGARYAGVDLMHAARRIRRKGKKVGV